MSRRREAGFSLIELLITLVVIGILAAIAIPAMRFAIDRSKQRTTMSDMRSLGASISRYYIDNSGYPDNSLTPTELLVSLEPYGGERMQPVDRWNHDYEYHTDGTSYYSVISRGRDGIDGGDSDFENRNDFKLDIVYVSGGFVASPEE